VIFIFVVIIVIIVGKILASFAQWSENNAQPERCDEATLVAKRTDVSGGKNSTSTTYYATFELAGGERKELEIPDDQFGLLVEGDRGSLKHQGTRFLGFARRLEPAEEPPAIAQANVPTNLVCAYCGSAIRTGHIKCDNCGWTWKPGQAETAGAQS
jgi:hypothetical protein